MAEQVAIYHFGPDPKLADMLATALSRLDVPFELHRLDIENTAGFLPEIFDWAIIAVTRKSFANPLANKLPSLNHDLVSRKGTIIVADHRLSKMFYDDDYGTKFINLSNWRGSRSDRRIRNIVNIITGPRLFESPEPLSTNSAEDSDERLNAARRVTQMQQERLGVIFEPSSEFLVVVSAGDEGDAEAAERPAVRQLHSEVLRKARHFGSVASRLDNQVGWQGIGGLCERLITLLDRRTEEIPGVVGSLYSAALEVGSFFELDAAIRRGEETYAGPLNAEVRRPLEDLLRSLAPWLRSFPTVKTMDDEAGQFLLPPSNLEAPEVVIQAADQTKLISTEDANALSALLDAARRGEYQGSKAGHRGSLSARNMIVAVVGLFGGLILSDYGGKSILIGKAGSFLARAEAGIIELVAHLPLDLRAAIDIVIREGKETPVLPPTDPRPAQRVLNPNGKRNPRVGDSTGSEAP